MKTPLFSPIKYHACISSEEMMKSEADGARHLQGYETSGERPNGLQVFEMIEETREMRCKFLFYLFQSTGQ
jgi:hypothetical protein